MSFYRLWRYPYRKECFKHLYFPRDRGKGASTADENAAGILERLEHDSKLDESLSRSRRMIRDLILCNYFEYFCTFTFSPEKVDRYDFAACKKKITELFKNYRNRRSNAFRYIIVPEFHKDGGIHFHGMVTGIRPEDFTVPDKIWQRNKRNGELKLVPNTKKYVDWAYYSEKLGFFSCSKVKHYEKCARYVSKYITKDLINLSKGARVFMASQGLNRPDLIFDADDVPRMFRNPDFENEFVSIKESADTFGVVPDWVIDARGECCTDLHGSEPDNGGVLNWALGESLEPLELLPGWLDDWKPDDGGALIEEDIFERMTGVQLALDLPRKRAICTV